MRREGFEPSRLSRGLDQPASTNSVTCAWIALLHKSPRGRDRTRLRRSALGVQPTVSPLRRPAGNSLVSSSCARRDSNPHAPSGAWRSERQPSTHSVTCACSPLRLTLVSLAKNSMRKEGLEPSRPSRDLAYSAPAVYPFRHLRVRLVPLPLINKESTGQGSNLPAPKRRRFTADCPTIEASRGRCAGRDSNPHAPSGPGVLSASRLPGSVTCAYVSGRDRTCPRRSAVG